MPVADPQDEAPQLRQVKVGTHMSLALMKAFTQEQCNLFDETIQSLCAQGETYLVLDCKKVLYMDSEALEHLLDAHEKVAAAGGKLKIVGLNSVCRDILTVTRLLAEFHVFGDLPEALRSR